MVEVVDVEGTAVSAQAANRKRQAMEDPKARAIFFMQK